MCLAEESLVPFSLENHAVNRSLIDLYESDPDIWNDEQCYLIGMCYVMERRLDDALNLFGRLHKNSPSNSRITRALGNIHDMLGHTAFAQKLFGEAWLEGQDVIALKQLAVTKLRTGDLDGFRPLIDDLVLHQTESIGIQKALLSYSIAVEDEKRGGPVYAAVALALDMDLLDDNPDLRKLVLLATARYKESGGGTQGALRSQHSTKSRTEKTENSSE